MPKSDSSAGDLAQVILDALEEKYHGNVEWIEGEHDTIGVTDENGVQMFVKVELA